jgi:hypothetical protein
MRTATFTRAGETVKCTFTNTATGHINVEKQTNPDGDPASFYFHWHGRGSISDGQQMSVNVIPGTTIRPRLYPLGGI